MYVFYMVVIYIWYIYIYIFIPLVDFSRSTPAAGFAALGYAAALAVSSPKALQPKGTEVRRLDITRCLGERLACQRQGFTEWCPACPSGPSSIIFLYVACCCHHLNEQATSKISLFYRFFLIRHAGINSKKMLGRAKHGFRERVVDLCPRISDWEEQGGTTCILVARAERVTKKANHGKSFQAPWHEGASYLQFTPTWFAFRPLLINLSISIAPWWMFSWYTQTSWKEYYLNDDAENVHARVYKSARAQVAVVSFRGTQAGLPDLLPSTCIFKHVLELVGFRRK